MKKGLLHLFVMAFISTVFFISCQKEISCEACKDNNKSPIAIAGPDQSITLPTDSIALDGSASDDPDGTISEWLWTKISGPVSFTIANPATDKTTVKDLDTGRYLFELRVKDNGGLFAKDTVQIAVNDQSQPNLPPIANAGPDLRITLPTNTLTLDGSGSSDPDNNIIRYAWIKISGPSLFNITNTNATQTQVTNLAQGVYQFELTVMDAGGLFSKDTVQVIVNSQMLACDNGNRPLVHAQLIPVGNLSMAREGIAVAAAGNKIVFAGGGCNCVNSSLSSRVDIYDLITQTWSTDELCVARNAITAVAAGNKIFFAGGEVGDGTWPVDSVDIYDVATNNWTVGHLSTAGHSIVAAAVGKKVFFAGGDQGFNGTPGILREKTVDIYDLNTNAWSIAQLSEGKWGGHSAVTINNKIYFAGGGTWIRVPNYDYGVWMASDKIDIYDNATNTWSTSSMQESKTGLAGIAVGDKIYWAGGQTGSSTTSIYSTCTVEIRDVNTGSSKIEYLFKPSSFGYRNAMLKDNKIVFYGSNVPDTNMFDIYDIATNTWSIGVLPIKIEEASVIAVNNTIYVAGGKVNGILSTQVWKLKF